MKAWQGAHLGMNMHSLEDKDAYLILDSFLYKNANEE